MGRVGRGGKVGHDTQEGREDDVGKELKKEKSEKKKHKKDKDKDDDEEIDND